MTQLVEQYEEYLVKYICKRIYSSLTILIYQKCFYIFLPIFIGFVFQSGGMAFCNPTIRKLPIDTKIECVN